MMLPKYVQIYEVGPRDGLQNESQSIATSVKIDLIERLANAGFTHVEATSFVSPKAVPQMADHAEVMAGIKRKKGTVYPVLVPNVRGMEAALSASVQTVAVFAAASETFSLKNINCSIEQSFARFAPIMEMAKKANIPVRGYVSCVVGCPYEGDTAPSAVAKVASELYEAGCYEISLGDTIGVGTPEGVRAMLDAVTKVVPVKNLALHFHDTYGRALDNIYAGLEMGVSVVDSSVAGLGGCPYAPGSSGNVASEDVLNMLHRLGIETGVDVAAVEETSQFISSYLGR
ncbi:MAG TPA: hydroxymethylglutaryl-CoA lyase [Candidatus Thioglobus sp.]|jgi:hydroxymethylglutaryl-CoA lyase|nr:hydroxymethylglutaryl-CoA lyase [Candidatus Thioglobus sp.]